MAYSDFTLKRVKSDLNIEIIENEELFPYIEGIEISQFLETMLKRNIPLALAINTEKARSELIIANILLEVKDQLKNEISFFSGIEFTVDKDRGLNGFCDFILSRSIEQFYLETPVVTIVEAKNENITGGLGQCIAEMYAAAIFNERESDEIACIYGAVTIGDEWKFVKLVGNTAYIDTVKYYANDIQKIVAILVEMLKKEHHSK
ncbi:hypothetical protein PN36_28215 [Candidatus Thiomargarita nelsonii]|uniref:Uncharacterized protein n=1 Tax=Candidatus Thiomargarita nelsonii TaxID=1003181 RepID=A0A0A6PC84_9GAMM|nr:hypothetical protein PN36_28215 [Candidatus Thiomargarita nelsonii]